jgi:very-short-patch-repair endonuclease
MVQRKEAVHCKKHVPKTPEWNAKNSAKQKGRQTSAETRAKISRAHGGKAYYLCEKCGTAFHAKAHQRAKGDGRFCSNRCAYDARSGSNAVNWRADMPRRKCRQCGKSFRLAAMSGKGYYCSLPCKAIWQKSHQKTKATDIERAMEAALKARGWRYKPQHPLCNCAVVDFYLPEWRVAIFCDGDYWHSLPIHAERDARQNATLTAAGYIVARFWGKEIHADVNHCLDQILAALPSPPSPVPIGSK